MGDRWRWQAVERATPDLHELGGTPITVLCRPNAAAQIAAATAEGDPRRRTTQQADPGRDLGRGQPPVVQQAPGGEGIMAGAGDGEVAHLARGKLA